MLFTFLVCLLVTSIDSAQIPVDMKPNDKVLVKLDPKQVVDAFKSVVSTDYLRNLAQDLAVKAAEKFLTLMKDKPQPETVNVTFKKPVGNRLNIIKAAIGPPPYNAASMKAEVLEEIERTVSENPIAPDLNIDVKQAMTLLQEPAPDGDNLDQISPNLSEDEEAKMTDKPQVIQLMKVNGKYVRRLFRFV